MTTKPLSQDLMESIAVEQERELTYIAAFRCLGGLVICADTLETVGEHKQYSEKLLVVPNQTYPLAIGGAGAADVIEPIMDEIVNRASEERPDTQADLIAMLKGAVNFVFDNEVPALALGKQLRKAEFLVAAKPRNEDYCIYRIAGKRVYRENLQNEIIGFRGGRNKALLKRFHHPSLPMQQAVMLATYLVSQSKAVDEGVGGETRVVVVRDNGAWIDDAEYIAVAEQRVKDFLALTDEMFLTCIDVSIAPPDYQAKVGDMMQRIAALREQYLRYSAAHSLNRAFHDPNYRGEPYPKLFPGAVTTVMGDGSVVVKEDTPEEIARRREMMAWAENQLKPSDAQTSEGQPSPYAEESPETKSSSSDG